MNLIKRTFFGAIYVALIVASLLLWSSTTALFVILFAAISVVATREASRLLSHNGTGMSNLLLTLDSLGTVALFAGAHFASSAFDNGKSLLLILAGIFFLVRLIAQLFLSKRDAIDDIRTSLAAVAYVTFPMAMLCVITQRYGPMSALLVFIFIWLNDTGAFLVGSAIGKHRLFERVSPKKSWEGVVGGLVVVVAATFLLPLIPLFSDAMPVAAWQKLCLAIIVVVAATLGDLFESLLKRSAGVKDSGNIIPGHGGILDRIDSLLFVAPAVVMTLEIFKIIQ